MIQQKLTKTKLFLGIPCLPDTQRLLVSGRQGIP